MKLLQFIRPALPLLLGLCPSLSHAEYSIRYLGSVVSKDEQLVDASRSGWLLVKDNTDPQGCVVRVKLGSTRKVRLCDKGLIDASHVNDKGLVLGKGDSDGKTLAVWGDRVGLKILDTPKEAYDSLTGTDFNNKGEVVGFSIKRVDGESYGEMYQAYRWRKDGSLSPIKISRTRKTQALALNDKGDVVVWAEKSGYRNALYVGNRRFRRIDRRGQGGVFAGSFEYGAFRINNRGQISSGGACRMGVFSPRRGWRQINELRPNDRCDYTSGKTDISDSGRALTFSDSMYLSEYPRPAVKLSCLVPQNRIISNAQIPVGNLYPFLDAARFVNNDAVVFSTGAEGDGASNQLFILERQPSQAGSDAIRDYCPWISFESKEMCVGGEDIKTCAGRFTVASGDGPLQGVTVNLYAIQAGEENCPHNLVDTFTSSASGNSYSVRTDPGFHYYFEISDPKFGDPRYTESYGLRLGYPIASPISPCRKPFEGLMSRR